MDITRDEIRELANELEGTDDSLQVAVDSLGIVYGVGYARYEPGDSMYDDDCRLLRNIERALYRVAGLQRSEQTGIWHRVKRKRKRGQGQVCQTS